MRILFMQLFLPIVTYFIGVLIGALIILRKEKKPNSSYEDDSIQHVGYTPEQMGYDK